MADRHFTSCFSFLSDSARFQWELGQAPSSWVALHFPLNLAGVAWWFPGFAGCKNVWSQPNSSPRLLFLETWIFLFTFQVLKSEYGCALIAIILSQFFQLCDMVFFLPEILLFFHFKATFLHHIWVLSLPRSFTSLFQSHQTTIFAPFCVFHLLSSF